MKDVKIVRSMDIEPNPLPGAEGNVGWLKRIIYPPYVVSKGVWLGIAEVIPGHSPHQWHSHQKGHKFEGYEVVYPKDFEEIYYIYNGNGVVQWKTNDGKIKEEKVSSGDAIFFPVGVAEHQLFNSGTQKLSLVFCGSPTHKVIYTK